MKIIVGFVDLIGGLILVLSLVQFETLFLLTLPIGAILLVKTVYNAVQDHKIHAIIDLVSGALLLLIAFSILIRIPFTEPIVLIVSIFLLAKGLFVVASTLVS